MSGNYYQLWAPISQTWLHLSISLESSFVSRPSQFIFLFSLLFHLLFHHVSKPQHLAMSMCFMGEHLPIPLRRPQTRRMASARAWDPVSPGRGARRRAAGHPHLVAALRSWRSVLCRVVVGGRCFYGTKSRSGWVHHSWKQSGMMRGLQRCNSLGESRGSSWLFPKVEDIIR